MNLLLYKHKQNLKKWGNGGNNNQHKNISQENCRIFVFKVYLHVFDNANRLLHFNRAF